MMYLVETTGNFMLMVGDQDNKEVRHEGYTLVKRSEFVHQRTVAGELRSVAEVNDQATDEEWLKYVAESDGDLDLAVASFQSAFPVEGKKQESKPAPTEHSKPHGRKPASR